MTVGLWCVREWLNGCIIVTISECACVCEHVNEWQNPFHWQDMYSAGPHPGHNAAVSRGATRFGRRITHAVAPGVHRAWRADGKKKKQTSKWVPVFSSFWSTVCAFQNKPNQGNTSGKSGWTYPSTAIKRWKQSVYINDEHGLVTLIRGDDNFKSVNFGEEAERGECPGKIWRICIMWVCPLLQKSFMPPKGFLGALRHHTEGRQAGRADSKWFLCKTAAALHHHAPFATMTRIICAPCKARRGPRRSSTLWTGPKHSESTPPPPPPKKNTHAKEK